MGWYFPALSSITVAVLHLSVGEDDKEKCCRALSGSQKEKYNQKWLNKTAVLIRWQKKRNTDSESYLPVSAGNLTSKLHWREKKKLYLERILLPYRLQSCLCHNIHPHTAKASTRCSSRCPYSASSCFLQGRMRQIWLTLYRQQCCNKHRCALHGCGRQHHLLAASL